MWNFEEKEFMNPQNKYRMKLMQHHWEKDTKKVMMDALTHCGYGGVVTNPFWNCEGKSEEGLMSEFSDTLNLLEKKDLGFWIYDEAGYPSGHAGGETLKDHPEYEAKGFYMIKRVSYPSNGTKKGVFHIDEETDKIIWAAKYPLIIDNLHDNYIDHKNMVPVDFTREECEYTLNEGEILTVFCVKSAYEGSHCTHNVSSFLRYINVMDERAVKRFIELKYEPLAKHIPDVYKRAEAVFTDEPSLQHTYRRYYESWSYALCPWVDGLFDEFYKEYGYSIYTYLPMLFEGRSEYYPEIYALRVQFYHLVGKLIAKSYTGQINEWLKNHGGLFSGHYIGEENLSQHVEFYGDFIEVIKNTGYPGVDNLWCVPEIYHYNTAKFAQMVVRKNNTNGMMVEMCPFQQRERFYKDARDNFCAMTDIMYMSGVRKVNSYVTTDFSLYDSCLKKYNSGMNIEDTKYVNNYIARMSYMLDGMKNNCDTFVYYNIENSQAKMVPSHTPLTGNICEADEANTATISRILEEGFDFYYLDRDDLLTAKESLIFGEATISDCKVKTVIVPKCDVIYKESVDALSELKKSGVNVIFIDKIPSVAVDGKSVSYEKITEEFTYMSLDDAILCLKEQPSDFTVCSKDVVIMQTKYTKDDCEMYFIHNNTRGTDGVVIFNHNTKKDAKIYNPSDGSVKDIKMGDKYTLPSYRGVFIVF
ncbi:MAG: hypothetical protein E7396_08670 [Ruminococcaceae bacterium]|nr:hypothetical protein [Oscillospiraceae bacterium]